MRIQRHAVPDDGVVIDNGERHDDDVFANLDIFANMSLLADALRELELRREQLEEFGKGSARLFHIKCRLREIPNSLRQHDSSRFARLRFFNMRVHSKGQVMLARPFDIVEALDDDGCIAFDTTANIIRNFLQGLFHVTIPSLHSYIPTSIASLRLTAVWQ